MDLDRITDPLRLAKVSHLLGTGKGCAMNAISYSTATRRSPTSRPVQLALWPT